MAASPPPLKRPRLSLGDGVTERTLGEARPIAFAASITKMGTTAAFGGVECGRCVGTINAVIEDRADPLEPDSETDKCFLCGKPGHWYSACPLDATEDHSSGMIDIPICSPEVTKQKPEWFARIMLNEAEWDGRATSLLHLSARAVALLPVKDLLEKKDIAIAPHVAAVEVVPRMPFHLIDRFYYEQPAQLSGAVTVEMHAVAMRRFIACMLHRLFVQWEFGLDVRPDVFPLHKQAVIPLWNVFGNAELLFAEQRRQRGVFEQKGDFLWEEGPAPRVVADADTAFANFERLSCGLVRHGDFEDIGAVAIAGGSVLGALILDPAVAVADSAFSTSDIDVFVLDGGGGGGKGACVAQMALCRIVANYKKLYPDGKYAIALRRFKDWSLGASRDAHPGCVATCFFEGSDLPTVQVILKKGIRFPEELLATFDVDCCGVALAAGQFVASAPAARALARGYNIFDPTFARRATYVSRLRKYATRGFPVFLPLKADALREPLVSSSFDSDNADALRGPLVSTSFDSDYADQDEALLRELCSPYVPCTGDEGLTEALYTPVKIPAGCTSVDALKAAFAGKKDVKISSSIDDFDHTESCIGSGRGFHLMHNIMESAPIHDVSNVWHIPAHGFPDHQLLAPIVFPCSFALFVRIKGLKRYGDKRRAKNNAAGCVDLPLEHFIDPKRPASDMS